MTRPPFSAAFRAARRLGAPIVAFVAVFITLLVTSRSAYAEASAKKTIAIYIEGTESGAVRTAVANVVADQVRVIDSAVFTAALTRAGLHGTFGNALTLPKQRDTALAKIRKAAAAAGADAVIAGRTRKSANSLSVWLLWIDASPGDLAVDEDVSLPPGASARKTALRGALGSSLDKLASTKGDSAAPPSKASPADAPSDDASSNKPANTPPSDKADKADTSAPSEPAGKGRSRESNQMSSALFIAHIAYEIDRRDFGYTDPITSARDFTSKEVSTPAIELEAYPAANTSIPVLKGLGVTASFARPFFVAATTTDGQQISAAWMRLSGGLRERLQLGRGMLGLSGSFDYTTFTFDANNPLSTSVPAVKYASLRVGLDGRIPFWRMALLLDTGYDGALSAGDVHDRFREAKVGGVDFGAGLAFTLGAGFEARLMAHYTRYFYAFNPVPGDAYVAGGALDEFRRIGLGVAYAY